MKFVVKTENRLKGAGMCRTSRASVFLAVLALSACITPRPPAYDLPDAASLRPGPEITVSPDDNLYTLSKKHGAQIRDIIVLNNMQPPYAVSPGQRLVLPSSSRVAPLPAAAPRETVRDVHSAGRIGEAVTIVPLEAAPQSAASASGKTVWLPEKKAEEKGPEPPTLSAVKEAVKTSAPPKAEETPPKAEETPPKAEETPPKAEEALLKAEEARPVPVASEASVRPVQPGVPSFAWPVRGTIVSAFGPKGKGRDNDGINIAAPKGAPVKAAEGGTIVYADNKMKGFGNLVLIRHEGGWVSAYAHLGRMLVKPDQAVEKGEMIGTVGTSGGVASAQLHFETRRDGKPVDPELVVR